MSEENECDDLGIHVELRCEMFMVKLGRRDCLTQGPGSFALTRVIT
jgi:hypothetical protein